MINFVVGKTGQGKTYYLTYIARRSIVQGRDVYSNFPLYRSKLIISYESSLEYKILRLYYKFVKGKEYKPKYGQIFRWQRLDQFIAILGAVILCDEGQIYFNSRKYFELPESVQYKFSQHRHDIVVDEKGNILNCDIWVAVQNSKRVDTSIREICNTLFKVRKVGKRFLISEYDIEEIDKVEKTCYGRKFLAFDKTLGNSYDTFTKKIIYKHDLISTSEEFDTWEE